MVFYSKNLILAKCNYQIYNKKLLVIIRYLKYQRSKLEYIDISIKIFTNYKDLIYFIKERNLSRRQTRYLNILFEFNIKIIYRLGPQNVKINIFIYIVNSKLDSFKNKYLKQQYQIILTSNYLELNNSDIGIYIIDNSIFHRIV